MVTLVNVRYNVGLNEPYLRKGWSATNYGPLNLLVTLLDLGGLHVPKIQSIVNLALSQFCFLAYRLGAREKARLRGGSEVERWKRG
jgi:hypothetical protein